MLCPIHLPGAIAHLRGTDQLTVETDTVAALECAYAVHPAPKDLLTDETGIFCEHVLCFHKTATSSTNTRWLPNLSTLLGQGDSLLIMQAVSGG
ncbi:MAG: molybdopterin converting factor small subunit [Planctomycetota bacterium]|jgi:molybdopterin converting factor small subunit